MGNVLCFGKGRSSKGVVVVHPLDHHHRLPEEGQVVRRRLKVRMTSAQLKELMAQVKKDDTNKGLSDSELGRLIFRECLKGRLQARVVNAPAGNINGSDDQYSTCRRAKGWGLTPIQEHSDDDDKDDDHRL